MAKSLQVTVTNPDDLNTLQGELVTKNYNLEILGLKNPADFRKFSKSLMMLDRILKETNDKVDNGLKEKLNKGSYDGDADDLKREIDGKEPAFSKKTGFNLEKSDSVTSNSSSTLATSAAVKSAYDKGVNAERIANTKEPAFSKKSGFNLEKTSDYKSADTNKVFTQQGANSLYKEVENEIDGKVSKSGGEMEGSIAFKSSNFSKQHQFVGFRYADNDLNKRFHEYQMGWSYTGVGDKGEVVNGFPMYNNANGVLSFNTHGGTFGHQIGLSSDGRLYHRVIIGGEISPWKMILESDSCPYNIGDIYITTKSGNPAGRWAGTGWSKIEGKYLYATSGPSSSVAGHTGGSNSIAISKANLPSTKLKVDQFALSRGSMNITGTCGFKGMELDPAGAFYHAGSSRYTNSGGSGGSGSKMGLDASKTWTGTTSTASPYTEALGSGTPLEIMPEFYAVHAWKRIS